MRQSANARTYVFLAVLLIALFIPVYWFVENGVPALGTEGRMAAAAEQQYVTDVARGYALFQANCATCHGASGQGGVGPPLNNQPKLYNALTADGEPGSGHLNPTYIDHVLTVGGRYVCGDPNSLMPVFKQPGGPLNYRQVEELIAWVTASSEITFEYEPESHEAGATAPEPVVVSGWRDPNWQPEAGATPPPACWRNPSGVIGGAAPATQAPADGGTASPAASAAPVTGGTADAPRVIKLQATADLKFVDEAGNQVTELQVVDGRDHPVRGRERGRLRPRLLDRHAGAAAGAQRHDRRGHPHLAVGRPDGHLDRRRRGPAVRLHGARPLHDHARRHRGLGLGQGRDVAQRALPPGALRRRAVFGLLDADGWTWALLRAVFWFLLIIFMLGYIPNMAYFLTVANTVKVGYNFASVINWCPAGNEDLPCPAPTGSTLPWQGSPAELALPAGREEAVIFQSGTTLYLIGGATEDGATDEVLVTHATTTDGQPNGNLSGWEPGPALPEPRADAAVGVYSGVPYVIGGLDASGAPTDTVFQGVVEEGVLTGWQRADGAEAPEDLTLPRPLSDAAVINGTSGFVLLGGRGADGQPTDGAYLAWVATDPPGKTLQPWQPLEGLALPEARADAVAGGVGDYLYLVGGEGPDGATDSVFRLEFVNGEPATGADGRPLGWAVAQEQLLPEARSDATGFVANGSIYVIGGVDADGQPQDTVYWVVPDTNGDLASGWQQLDQTDLAAPRVGRATRRCRLHRLPRGRS